MDCLISNNIGIYWLHIQESSDQLLIILTMYIFSVLFEFVQRFQIVKHTFRRMYNEYFLSSSNVSKK